MPPGAIDTAADMELGELEDATLGRTEPQHRKAGHGPRKYSLAVREQHRLRMQITADRDDTIGVGAPWIRECADRHASKMPQEEDRAQTWTSNAIKERPEGRPSPGVTGRPRTPPAGSRRRSPRSSHRHRRRPE